MISIDDALTTLDHHIRGLEAEPLDLASGTGRVLAQDVLSLTDLPRFDQSAMDGYAVIAADLSAATDTTPVALELTGTAPAGTTDPELKVASGGAVRILTGGQIPAGADSVVPQELTEQANGRILFRRPAQPGSNIRRRSEELASGARLARAGQRLTPGRIAALIMGGHTQVSVTALPRVAALTTGDELRSPGSELAAGEIHDSNGPLMLNWLASQGISPVLQRRLPDDEALIREALAEALESADLVLTSGGVSVGDRDYLIPVAESLGVERHYWKVAQKPGKPIYFGTRGGSALLGLPGNPGAVLVGLEVHAARILDRLQGVRSLRPHWQCGLLAGSERVDARRDRLLRMRHSNDSNGRTLLHPLGLQDSHMLSNLTDATALVRLRSREADYDVGETVEWIALSP